MLDNILYINLYRSDFVILYNYSGELVDVINKENDRKKYDDMFNNTKTLELGDAIYTTEDRAFGFANTYNLLLKKEVNSESKVLYQAKENSGFYDSAFDLYWLGGAVFASVGMIIHLLNKRSSGYWNERNTNPNLIM